MKLFNEKNNVFFGEHGLTITSANHIANTAKEYNDSVKESIVSLSVYKKSVGLLDSTNEKVLCFQSTLSTLNDTKNNIQRLYESTSLIAWLREAIKAKQYETKAISNYTLTDYMNENGIDLGSPYIDREPITEEECIANMSIKQRNEYFSLQTKCAVIGELIHPRGSLSEKRKRMMEAFSNPTTTSGSNPVLFHH